MCILEHYFRTLIFSQSAGEAELSGQNDLMWFKTGLAGLDWKLPTWLPDQLSASVNDTEQCFFNVSQIDQMLHDCSMIIWGIF